MNPPGRLTLDGPAVQLLTLARDLVAAAQAGLHEAAPEDWTGPAADQHATVLADLRGAVHHLHQAVTTATELARRLDAARHEAHRHGVTP